MHLGIGAFHRAHQAYYTEQSGDWGIVAFSQRTAGVVHQLAPQDGLYTLLVRDGDDARPRVMGAVREVRFAGADPSAVTRRIADPGISVVTLTVSEKGYRHDPATKRLRLDDPEIVADLAGRAAHTVVGQLVAGLAARLAAEAGPINVVCCDNLPRNGSLLRSLVLSYSAAYAAAHPRLAGLPEWIDEHVAFPATVVDRIVPAATGDDVAQVAGLIGLEDHGAVVAEPFSQWVIQDWFTAPRPAWETAGVELAVEVAPYENVKLRLLNGTHSALAYLGGLAGHEFISQVLADDVFAAYAHSLMLRDSATTIEPPPGVQLAGYADSVLRRFRNPALRHTTSQVSMDGSQKLPQRLLGTIAERLAGGAVPAWAGLAVAGWMRHVWTQRTDAGAPFPVNDPMAGLFARRLAAAGVSGDEPEQSRAVVAALLGIEEVFGALAESASLRSLLVEQLTLVAREGARGALVALG